jgi:hypothetical protein
MTIDPAEILHQIEAGQWKWVGVKRFRPESYATLEERYAALDRHHAEETGNLIEIIKELSRRLAAQPK